MRVIRSHHCRVHGLEHGLGQSLCCRVSPRWAQDGKWGIEGQEQPLWSFCGRESLEIFRTSLQLFLRQWETMGKAQSLILQMILEGKNPHELEWELHIAETVCENVGKLWYSSRQQSFLPCSFAFEMTMWYKESSTTENNCAVFSARFSEKGDTFWGVTDFRLNKVCHLLTIIVLLLSL